MIVDFVITAMTVDSSERKIHLFVDISNILIGSRAMNDLPGLRLNIPALVEAVSRQREIVRKVSSTFVS